jgi:hypothetical protein
MGSELVDVNSAKVLWGFRDPTWYVRAWTTGAGLQSLRLTEEERAGLCGRVKATGLLRFAAFARILAGFEPYSALSEAIHAVVPHPAAVLEFAYDWRLPVDFNASLLAEASMAHLANWRAHPAYQQALHQLRPTQPARLVFVAHSMGGLLVRYLSLIPGTTDDVRASVILGTPFYGSVKAALLLNCGRGLPVPRRRPMTSLLRRNPDAGLRALAATLPAVHDLLPTYRCLDETSSARRFTTTDIAELGGDPELAEASAALHRRLAEADLISPRLIIGTAQPTPQSLTLRDGVATAHQYTCEGPAGAPPQRVDRRGDATVFRDSATLSGASLAYLPQRHGSLPKTKEAIAAVIGIITERADRLGPPLGPSEVGLDVPDCVTPQSEWYATITGVTNIHTVRCLVSDAATNLPVTSSHIMMRDGRLQSAIILPRPGIYRISLTISSIPSVSELVLALDPDLD